VNIGLPIERRRAHERVAVKLIQENFDNIPLSLDTSNKAAIEAGISVYNRSKGKPIVQLRGRGRQDRQYRSGCSK
jgi:5-methyltetrahydrofolate corrinoid/iron sulfur protein methyltransferase